MGELVGKRGSVVLFAVVVDIFSYSIAIVRYSVTTFEPSGSFLSHFLRVYTNFHAKIEQTIRFGKVHYIESNCQVFPCVLYLVVEPLSMSVGINIILHKQIILIIRHFLRKIKITTLKLGFE